MTIRLSDIAPDFPQDPKSSLALESSGPNHANELDGAIVIAGLFAFDEVAWLQDEAEAVLLRNSSQGARRPHAPGAVMNVHVIEPAFRKLASHPRILYRVEGLAGGPVGIDETRLTSRTGETSFHFDRGRVAALMCLTRSAPSPWQLGTVILRSDERANAAFQIPPGITLLIVRYALASRSLTAISPERDDCLWPTPFFAAG